MSLSRSTLDPSTACSTGQSTHFHARALFVAAKTAGGRTDWESKSLSSIRKWNIAQGATFPPSPDG
jgi:hypothetical protein